MKIIIPMAGRGSRLRPHTLTTPKPLVKVAGKSIVQRLVEDIMKIAGNEVTDIAFIVGDFGDQVTADLKALATSLGANGHVFQQEEALGTAHAILCAQELMDGPCIIAFADTLFKADFTLDQSKDGVLWVKQIPNPEAFGVVQLDQEGIITDFVEKPSTFVSDLAMIGIYFFKDGARLKGELQYLIDHNIIKGGEYQLPDALANMKNKGAQFIPGKVDAWLDCGNKDATIDSNQQVLGFIKDEDIVADSAKLENAVIIPPCFIGENVVIKNSVVGPYTSIGNNSVIEDARLVNSMVQEESTVKGLYAENSMIGNKVVYKVKAKDLSVGDYNQINE